MPTLALTPPRTAKLARKTAKAGARTWWKTIKLALRVPPPRTTARLVRMRAGAVRTRTQAAAARRGPSAATRLTTPGKLAAVAVAGAGAEYLLDPVAGKRRRHELRDRSLAVARRVGRRGAQQVRYAEGKVEGTLHDMTSTPGPPADDRALVDRVQSEVFRDADTPKGAVNVGVSNGVVYLRGELPDERAIVQLVERTRRVPGVRDVESLLHTPQTPAPSGGSA